MSDNIWTTTSKWPDRHFAITPSDTVNLSQPMVVYALTAGTVTIVSRDDVAIQYTLAVGQSAPCLAKRVNATGTAATVAGVY